MLSGQCTFPFNVVAANRVASGSAFDCRIVRVVVQAPCYNTGQRDSELVRSEDALYRFLKVRQIVHGSLLLARVPATHGCHRRQNRVWGKAVERSV